MSALRSLMYWARPQIDLLEDLLNESVGKGPLHETLAAAETAEIPVVLGKGGRNAVPPRRKRPGQVGSDDPFGAGKRVDAGPRADRNRHVGEVP